ncbi:MAG: diaminopimelate epimerase [Candidatus Hodarchaeales archaeon]
MDDFIIENLEFEKMHGLGNDYIMINDLKYGIPNSVKSKLAIKICQQHFSIGADGLIFVCRSNRTDIRMRIYNNDGSEAEMCGNGIRCFSKYVFENNIERKNKIGIETLKGIMVAELNIVDNVVKSVKINMGQPFLKCESVPVISLKNEKYCLNEPIEVLDRKFNFSAVSMGNPHAVIFLEDQLNDEDLHQYGEVIEPHERFPKKVNVEFVKVLSETEGILRVYERGVGITKSCGTGTCAAVVAGVKLGKFKENTPINVHNDGGDLIITYTGETVFMEGPVERVFKGVIEKLEI